MTDISNSLIFDFESRISLILKNGNSDRARRLFDEYRTTNSASQEAFLLVLMTRLCLEHDRRVLTTNKAER